jgi:coatomer subunit beta'
VAGHVHIWSYISQSIVKTFELTDVPVRAGRFIARKNWIVAGETLVVSTFGIWR